jgi:Tfp pilus assembly protein PilF
MAVVRIPGGKSMRFMTAFTNAGNRNLIGLAVALAAFLIYANSLGNGFVWDDYTIIVSNPALEGGAADLFTQIDTASETEKNPYYRPVTLLTFLIEKRLHDSKPFPMHLVNVLIHAVNSYLVYRLAFALITNEGIAFIAGILFALHPISAESVNFLSARNNLLSGLFSFSSCLLHIRGIRERKYGAVIAAAALFLTGLFCKETALALLPVIFLFELRSWPKEDGIGRQRMILRLIPYLIFTLCYFLLRNNALAIAGVNQDILSGLFSRLAENLYIIPRYILLIINPIALSPRYTIPEDLNLLILPLVLGWLSIICAVAWLFLRGRTPLSLFGLAWLILFWLPVSGIVDLPSAHMADRYMYLPAIGIWLITADQSARLFTLRNSARRYARFLIIIVLLFFAVVTVRRNADWKSEIILFTRTVEQYPDNAWGHAELGLSYLRASSSDGSYHAIALRELQRALSLDPSLKRLHSPIGTIVLAQGDLTGALNHFSEALSADPVDRQALLYRAMTLEGLGRTGEALADYISFLSAPGRGLTEMRPFAEDKARELGTKEMRPE